MDNAESFSINRKRMVATTTARDGTIRAVSRGTQPRRIEVKLPDGIAWTALKSNIEAAEALDRISTATLTIPFAKFPWYYNNINPGTNESYTVRCIQFPEWNIFAYNQVAWSGSFVFQQVI
jgi:hypothetical protein